MRDFSLVHQLLPGVCLLKHPHFLDNRGSLEKFYNVDGFNELGFNFVPKECFLSESHADVLRGMHYQRGEAAHDKLVTCIRGRILDVIVDIRPESPNFNKPVSFELMDETIYSIYIGKGYAHGFLTLEDNSLILYHTSTVHSPSHDVGVLWSSIDVDWPTANPIISSRDQSHPDILSLS